MSQLSCLQLSLTKHPKPELNISHCASVMTGPVKLTNTDISSYDFLIVIFVPYVVIDSFHNWLKAAHVQHLAAADNDLLTSIFDKHIGNKQAFVMLKLFDIYGLEQHPDLIIPKLRQFMLTKGNYARAALAINYLHWQNAFSFVSFIFISMSLSST